MIRSVDWEEGVWYHQGAPFLKLGMGDSSRKPCSHFSYLQPAFQSYFYGGIFYNGIVLKNLSIWTSAYVTAYCHGAYTPAQLAYNRFLQEFV